MLVLLKKKFFRKAFKYLLYNKVCIDENPKKNGLRHEKNVLKKILSDLVYETIDPNSFMKIL